MYYDFRFTIPANTAEDEALQETLELTQGTIQRIEVQFPIGTLALMHCKLFYHEHQVWPTNPDGDFASDGYVIPIDEWFPLDTEPYELGLVAWNDDDTYDHTLTVRVGLLRPEEVEATSGFINALKKMLGLMGIRV